MFANLIPFKTFLLPLAFIALVAAIFFAGRHSGAAMVQGKWNVQKMEDARALADELSRQAKETHRYAEQIATAESERDRNRADLALLRAAPHPRLVCHSAPSSERPVPSIPGAPPPGSAGHWSVPQGSDFDPSDRLYSEVADPSDNAIESCRDLYNRWPH